METTRQRRTPPLRERFDSVMNVEEG
jgi:hypothetical protein